MIRSNQRLTPLPVYVRYFRLVIDRDTRIGSGLPKPKSKLQRVKMARTLIQTTTVISRSIQMVSNLSRVK